MAIDEHYLQSGIHWLGSLPSSFRLIQINISTGASRSEVRTALETVWAMLADLRVGILRDFRNQAKADEDFPRFDPNGLSVALMYGRRFFDDKIHVPALVPTAARPRLLRYLGSAPFRSLHWKDPDDLRHDPEKQDSLQTDLGLQLTANSELAVNRVIVELHKLISDEHLPLRIVRFSAGFKREDHRSWIDFHDGINNMTPEQRRTAIEVIDGDLTWMVGGTYMAHLKIPIDLQEWRRMTRVQQELVVGRDKFWGCPIETTTPDMQNNPSPVLHSQCPFTGTFNADTPPEIIDPGQASDRIVAASHIHRANLLRVEPIPDNDSANRIYRQGFEFLDDSGNGQISLGLNFIGFVRSLRVINDILAAPGWMGDVNFGSTSQQEEGDPPSVRLMSISIGSYYAVPPDKKPFPGAELWELQ